MLRLFVWMNRMIYVKIGKEQKDKEVEIMTKEKLTLEIIERLREEYPDADCTLEYEKDQAWKLLVGVRLAAQCTDARVNIVTADLFQKYDTLEKFANADLKELEQDIKPTGFYHNRRKYHCLYQRSAVQIRW